MSCYFNLPSFSGAGFPGPGWRRAEVPHQVERAAKPAASRIKKPPLFHLSGTFINYIAK
jgi:hypothetical protein